MSNPLVSVIIPTFKRSDYLIRAIESALNQSYKDIEVIIVDDNDGDNEFREATLRNVQLYIANNKVIYLKHEVNRGAPAARNTGLQNAQGEYIAFLDDDDEWMPEKLDKQIKLFNTLGDDYGVVGCFWRIVNEFDNKITTRKLKYRGDLSKIFALNHFAPTSMVVIKTSYLKQVNGFDITFNSRQDVELYYRLSFLCKFDFVEEELVTYYQHAGGMSTNYKRKLDTVIQYLDKHGETTIKNQTPWSEINEYLAELHAVNGEKAKAVKSFLTAFFSQPKPRLLIKMVMAVVYNKDVYKRKRNFK
ncbi:MAG: glycosyltransferase family 2 protein [Bacteroidota bacterium]